MDKVLKDTHHFDGMNVVVTEKMDGENTTIYRNAYHARSLDSKHREYHSYLLNRILPNMQWQIPDNWRVCGEYLYAKHSIKYEALEDYFLAFSVWNDKNECLSWSDTYDFCYGADICCMVPILYEGLYSDEKIKELAQTVVERGGEGIVVRNWDSFRYEDFNKNVAKYVRKGHVQTENHWSFSKVEINGLTYKRKEAFSAYG